MQAVGLHADKDVDAEADDQRQQEDVPLAPARHQELRQEDAGYDQGGAEVPLEDDQQCHESQQREEGNAAVLERPKSLPVALQPERHEDDGGDLSQLTPLQM